MVMFKKNEPRINNTIKDSSFFMGVKEVKWDKDASECVRLVARALVNLTELFQSQNVIVNCSPIVEYGNDVCSGDKSGDKEESTKGA
jgi:hypothetical protein